ncbi:MAG: hypothetical protein KBC24_02935, partial [Caldisericia bacterium]|nr:hypothetical protein [Caldisericia bacterium]
EPGSNSSSNLCADIEDVFNTPIIYRIEGFHHYLVFKLPLAKGLGVPPFAACSYQVSRFRSLCQEALHRQRVCKSTENGEDVNKVY